MVYSDYPLKFPITIKRNNILFEQRFNLSYKTKKVISLSKNVM